jgi:hypothetical protein
LEVETEVKAEVDLVLAFQEVNKINKILSALTVRKWAIWVGDVQILRLNVQWLVLTVKKTVIWQEIAQIHIKVEVGVAHLEVEEAVLAVGWDASIVVMKATKVMNATSLNAIIK